MTLGDLAKPTIQLLDWDLFLLQDLEEVAERGLLERQRCPLQLPKLSRQGAILPGKTIQHARYEGFQLCVAQRAPAVHVDTNIAPTSLTIGLQSPDVCWATAR